MFGAIQALKDATFVVSIFRITFKSHTCAWPIFANVCPLKMMVICVVEVITLIQNKQTKRWNALHSSCNNSIKSIMKQSNKGHIIARLKLPQNCQMLQHSCFNVIMSSLVMGILKAIRLKWHLHVVPILSQTRHSDKIIMMVPVSYDIGLY